MHPAYGNIADAVNTGISVARGDLKDAGGRVLSAVPAVGIAVTGKRLAKQAKNAKKVLVHVDEVLDYGDEVAEGVSKAARVRKNAQQGKEFEQQVKAAKELTQTDVVEQITVKTQSGTRTRLDLVGIDADSGQVKLTEAKSSQTAPLTKNQKKGFPEIEQSGATVVGQGKPPFTGGTQIPPTQVDIERPEL